MEHLSTGLASIMAMILRNAPADEAIRMVWPLVCGSAVAARTKPLDFSEGVLRVSVPDKIWFGQLCELQWRYVSEFARVLGNKSVRKIEFVVSR